MRTATISEVKNRLSAYLRAVKAGETVLILDRDQPVAMLKSVDEDLAPDQRLVRLEKQGLLRRSVSGNPLGALTGPVDVAESVVEAMLEERRDGR